MNNKENSKGGKIIETILHTATNNNGKGMNGSSGNTISNNIANSRSSREDATKSDAKKRMNSGKLVGKEISSPDLVSDKGLNMEWIEIRSPGVGIENAGNTCFLNSVLQALTYTTPLFNYLLVKSHQC